LIPAHTAPLSDAVCTATNLPQQIHLPTALLQGPALASGAAIGAAKPAAIAKANINMRISNHLLSVFIITRSPMLLYIEALMAIPAMPRIVPAMTCASVGGGLPPMGGPTPLGRSDLVLRFVLPRQRFVRLRQATAAMRSQGSRFRIDGLIVANSRISCIH